MGRGCGIGAEASGYHALWVTMCIEVSEAQCDESHFKDDGSFGFVVHHGCGYGGRSMGLSLNLGSSCEGGAGGSGEGGDGKREPRQLWRY